MFSLSGRKALVTGASGGLGYGIVKTLLSQGATVIATGTREDALRALSDEMGERCIPLPWDLNQIDSLGDLIKAAEEKMGSLDILVNNAGLTRDSLLMRMKDEDFQKVISINLEAPFALIRSAIRGMIKRRFGRIINISSVVGTTGNPGQANYCASKAGLEGMSKSIAIEVASRGITVNCVAPGFMSSSMTDALNDTQKEQILSKIPMGSMGSHEDIGAAVAYLSSDEASYITGQTLHVNGGIAMV
jgi:3-oxoacyl-[acyl-carrier protein] reductase